SSVDGESPLPVTDADTTSSYGGRSSADTNCARQWVNRVHARSVSPATYDRPRVRSVRTGLFSAAESVMRRCANLPNGSVAGDFGPVNGHHATIGASGSNNGTTTLGA